MPVFFAGLRPHVRGAATACLVFLVAIWPVPVHAGPTRGPEPRFVDLSLLVSTDYPCIWPTFPPFQINHYE